MNYFLQVFVIYANRYVENIFKPKGGVVAPELVAVFNSSVGSVVGS